MGIYDGPGKWVAFEKGGEKVKWTQIAFWQSWQGNGSGRGIKMKITSCATDSCDSTPYEMDYNTKSTTVQSYSGPLGTAAVTSEAGLYVYKLPNDFAPSNKIKITVGSATLHHMPMTNAVHFWYIPA